MRPADPAPGPVPRARPVPLVLPERGRALDTEAVRRLVSYGIQAPSGGNVQPWQFVSRGQVLECRLDDAQPSTLLDFERSARRDRDLHAVGRDRWLAIARRNRLTLTQ